MGCGSTVVKYFLFLFNLIFVIGAIAYIAIGVVYKINVDKGTDMFPKSDINLSAAPTVVIVIGVITFLIAFFGCCGAIRESTCMLTTYAIILLTLFILQLAVGIYVFVQYKNSNEDIRTLINTEMNKTFSKYYTDNEFRGSVDETQKNLQCCGVESPAYWRQYTHSDEVPASCCPDSPSKCYIHSGAYPEGCGTKLVDLINKGFTIIGIVIFVIAAVMLGGAIMALCLSSSIRNSDRRGRIYA